jgi:hypothetical protein
MLHSTALRRLCPPSRHLVTAASWLRDVDGRSSGRGGAGDGDVDGGSDTPLTAATFCAPAAKAVLCSIEPLMPDCPTVHIQMRSALRLVNHVEWDVRFEFTAEAVSVCEPDAAPAPSGLSPTNDDSSPVQDTCAWVGVTVRAGGSSEACFVGHGGALSCRVGLAPPSTRQRRDGDDDPLWTHAIAITPGARRIVTLGCALPRSSSQGVDSDMALRPAASYGLFALPVVMACEVTAAGTMQVTLSPRYALHNNVVRVALRCCVFLSLL